MSICEHETDIKPAGKGKGMLFVWLQFCQTWSTSRCVSTLWMSLINRAETTRKSWVLRVFVQYISLRGLISCAVSAGVRMVPTLWEGHEEEEDILCRTRAETIK